MLLKPKKLKDLKSPPLYLCNNQLDFVDNCRYLGIKIENYSYKSDMKRQLCKFCHVLTKQTRQNTTM